MSRLSLTEQTRFAKLLVDRSCRAASARLKRSSLLKWRYGAPVADKLLLVPQDLRSSDPSFASEIEFGHFGLAGSIALVNGRSVFEVEPPTAAWARELHGFGWLRHLSAAGHLAAHDCALELVADWINRFHSPSADLMWQPSVAGRRLMSWIVNATFLLDDAGDEIYDATTNSLADHIIHLAATWHHAPDGLQRLEALTALLMGTLCVSGHEQTLDVAAKVFATELELQILPDGGHVSRNPGVLVELLLDFLPLRQCFATRERPLPEGFDLAVQRMLKMLRFMRLGDGRLGRFNGMSAHMIDALSTVLAYDDRPQEVLPAAPHSKYLRIKRGKLIVLMDVGQPPPLELATDAHAGCLSFELSSGPSAIFVNGGAPLVPNAEWKAAARSTASHNTLCLGGRSSSKLVRHGKLDELIGGTAIRFPAGIEYECKAREGSLTVEAFHDGYFHRFKLLHRRQLEIDASGKRITGVDKLCPQRGQLRLAEDVPFAIHFHLDDAVERTNVSGQRTATLALADGQLWRFEVSGAFLTVEDSIRYAGLGGPRQSQQIVLRGATFGESEVRWSLEQVI